MTARSSIALLIAALWCAPAALAEDTAKKPEPAKDSALQKTGRAPVSSTAKTPPAPPTGSEVGQALDAMAASCAKALALHTEIAALVGKVKAAKQSRLKSGSELRRKLQAIKLSRGKVARAAKKPGSDAAALVETARSDYESALADGKTFEVETQSIQASEDQLIALVLSAEQASAACLKYEETVRAAASHAKKVAQEAKRNAVKARVMAALRQEKALAADRAKHAKEVEAVKAQTEGARTELDAMKGEAAQQPAADTTKPAAPAPSGQSGKKHHEGHGDKHHGSGKGKKHDH